MVCVDAVALSSVTYAWFVNNTKVTASQVNVTASTAIVIDTPAPEEPQPEYTSTDEEMNNLAFGYILPTAGWIRDFHPLETCAVRRTTIKSLLGSRLFLKYNDECTVKPWVLSEKL